MADETIPSPLPSQPMTTATAPRTEPLAIWSLALAIPFLISGWLLSFFGLPVGVFAIICGHVARSKIRTSVGAVCGMGMALSGLLMAYIGRVPATVMCALSATVLF